jgi:hypothetical protein
VARLEGFTVNLSGIAQTRRLAEKHVRRITEDVERDAKRRVPVDTGELRATIHSTHHGLKGRVWVGTDHWAPTEYGSGPHFIRVKNAKVLHNAETGDFFGRRVWHPGTPAQPFMRPALYTKRPLGGTH